MDKNFVPLEYINNIGTQCHNLYVEGNFVYSLCSANASISKINLSTKQTEIFELEFRPNNKTPFLRGMAKHKDGFLIGATEHINKESRNDTTNWIVCTDNQFKIVDAILSPSRGAIKEIRIMNQRDYCHSDVIFPSDML
jgi:hypothetical protein